LINVDDTRTKDRSVNKKIFAAGVEAVLNRRLAVWPPSLPTSVFEIGAADLRL